MKNLVISLFLLVNLGCASSPVQETTTPDMETLGNSFQTMIFEAMKNEDLPGLALTVYTPDLGTWTAGYGNTAGWGAVPVTPQTGFCLGSISKTFTAAAVVNLAREGKIDLDAPLRTYIPEFRIQSRFPGSLEVTVKHLLTHTSGVPSDRYVDIFSGKTGDFRSALDFIQGDYLLFPPGERTSYTNLGYALLGILIERVTGRDFYDYEREEILKPLGMVHSDFDKNRFPVALRSKGQLPGWALDEPTYWTAPASSLWSTAQDLRSFFKAMDDRWQDPEIIGVLDHNSQNLMRTIPIPLPLLNNGKEGGLGVWPDPLPWNANFPVLYHDGGTLGFNTIYLWIPEERIGIAIFSNKRTGFKEALTNQILQRIRTLRGWDTPIASKKPYQTPASLSLPEGRSYFALKEGLYTLDRQGENYTWTLEGLESDSGTLTWKDGVALILGKTGMVREKVIFLQSHGRLIWVRTLKTGEVNQEYRGSSVTVQPLNQTWRSLAGTWEISNPTGIEGLPLPASRDQVTIAALSSHLNLSFSPGLTTGFQKISFNFLPVNEEQVVKMGSEERDSGTTAYLKLVEGVPEIRYMGIILRRVK